MLPPAPPPPATPPAPVPPRERGRRPGATTRLFVPDLRSPWLRILLAVGLAAFTNYSYRAAQLWAGEESYFVLAFIAVMVSAWAGRLASGLLTLALCVGLQVYYFGAPPRSFELHSLEDFRLLLLFLAAGVLICVLIEGLYVAKEYGERLAAEGGELAEDLRTERDRRNALLANLPGLVWEATLEPGLDLPLPTFFSANVESLLGWSSRELRLSTLLWDHVVHPDDRDRFAGALRAAANDASDAGASSFRHRWILRDGRARWFETHFAAGAAYGDGIPRVRCVSVDVSETQRAARAVAESEIRFRAAADRAPIMIWVAHGAAGIHWCNRAWLEFRGRSLGQELGLGWRDGVHPEDLPRLERAARRAYVRQQELRLDCRVRRADGDWRWLLLVGVPRADADGRFQDFLGFCVDITDRKQVDLAREQLLEQTELARREAELVTRSKDEFLAKVSHELRNPLNGILGWTQILRRGDASDEEIARGIELIDAGARALTQLVDDLLDVSRIIAGKMQLTLEPTNLRGVVDAACQSVRPAAEAKGVTLDCVLDEHVPPVMGDSRRLQQVFWNLLSNGVKFTPRGGRVEVRVAVEHDAVVVRVSDTGIGIAPEFLPSVFAPFVQEEASSSRRYRGLGLGLAIVHHLVELHGGRVSASSPGAEGGATFVIRLPMAEREELAGAAVEAPPPAPRGSARLAGLRVLVVDDDPASREMLAALLGHGGAVVRTAASAHEGFAALLSFRPDVLLSDIEMPGDDGYSLLRRVRGLTMEEGGSVPAAALTAYARDQDRHRALLAGYQTHLAKPVETEALFETVARLAGRA